MGEGTRTAGGVPGSRTLSRMARAHNYNNWLVQRSKPHLGDRILDVGAGLGTFTELVAEGRELVVALEADPTYVEHLQKRFRSRGNIEIAARDASDIDANQFGATFDSVICFNVLEHIADDRSALNRLRDQLRINGRLLLLVPAHPALFGEIDRTVLHERRYGKEQLRSLLDSAGFDVETLRHVNPIGAVGWLLASRLLRRRDVPAGPLSTFDRLVPLLRLLDRARLPFGLSLWAVARRHA